MSLLLHVYNYLLLLVQLLVLFETDFCMVLDKEFQDSEIPFFKQYVCWHLVYSDAFCHQSSDCSVNVGS